jgi:toxin-antitoxin system PIN domain toxin
MSLFLLPDVNVWVAINHNVHKHHSSAINWFNALDEQSTLIFCRQTQMGLFRLLTTQAILGDETFTMKQCWKLYAEWIHSESAELWIEPAGMEDIFARNTASDERSPKRWNDAYLAAFAETAGLTLVTFDKALAAKTSDSILLK